MSSSAPSTPISSGGVTIGAESRPSASHSLPFCTGPVYEMCRFPSAGAACVPGEIGA